MNSSRGQTLADRARDAGTAWARLRGLLGRDELRTGEGIFLHPCRAIHSLGMRLVFDAVFVDRDGIVLHVIPHMKPWRFSKIVAAAAGVIELPAGTIERTGTQVGDRLSYEMEGLD